MSVSNNTWSVCEDDVLNTKTYLENKINYESDEFLDDLTREDYCFIHIASSVIIDIYFRKYKMPTKWNMIDDEQTIINCFTNTHYINNEDKLKEFRELWVLVLASKTAFCLQRQEESALELFMLLITDKLSFANYKSSIDKKRLLSLILTNTEDLFGRIQITLDYHIEQIMDYMKKKNEKKNKNKRSKNKRRKVSKSVKKILKGNASS